MNQDEIKSEIERCEKLRELTLQELKAYCEKIAVLKLRLALEADPVEDEYLSDCCAAGPVNDYGICPKCGEHCGWENENGEEL